MASSVRGIPRATRDVDIVAFLAKNHATMLARELGKDWYADADQMLDAIQQGRSFNLIHIPTGNKIDIFPAAEDFHAAQSSARQT